MGFINFLARSLDTIVSPMVYIMTFVSFMIGFGYTFLGSQADIQNTLLYKYGVFINASDLNIWGILLMIGAVVTIIGLVTRMRGFAEPGSMICFLMWAFASYTYLGHGFYFLLITFGLFHMIFFGYVYLTSSLGIITRVAIRKLGEINND